MCTASSIDVQNRVFWGWLNVAKNTYPASRESHRSELRPFCELETHHGPRATFPLLLRAIGWLLISASGTFFGFVGFRFVAFTIRERMTLGTVDSVVYKNENLDLVFRIRTRSTLKGDFVGWVVYIEQPVSKLRTNVVGLLFRKHLLQG